LTLTVPRDDTSYRITDRYTNPADVPIMSRAPSGTVFMNEAGKIVDEMRTTPFESALESWPVRGDRPPTNAIHNLPKEFTALVRNRASVQAGCICIRKAALMDQIREDISEQSAVISRARPAER